jgi:hypothetical protein
MAVDVGMRSNLQIIAPQLSATASLDPSIRCNPEQLAGRQIQIEMRNAVTCNSPWPVTRLRRLRNGTSHCQKVAACDN